MKNVGGLLGLIAVGAAGVLGFVGDKLFKGEMELPSKKGTDDEKDDTVTEDKTNEVEKVSSDDVTVEDVKETEDKK